MRVARRSFWLGLVPCIAFFVPGSIWSWLKLIWLTDGLSKGCSNFNGKGSDDSELEDERELSYFKFSSNSYIYEICWKSSTTTSWVQPQFLKISCNKQRILLSVCISVHFQHTIFKKNAYEPKISISKKKLLFEVICQNVLYYVYRLPIKTK